MKPAHLTLRCYVEREASGEWFAMCIDLNLCAQGSSADEAECKLRQQVEHYVREALTIDREYANHLLHRKAPLGFRLRYYVIAAMTRLWTPPLRTVCHLLPECSMNCCR